MSRHAVLGSFFFLCLALAVRAEEPPKPVDPPKAEDPAPGPVETAKVIEGYIADLSSDDPILASEAYDALLEIGRPAVLPLANKLAAKDTSADAKYLICDILGELREATAVQALLPILKDPLEHVSSVASAAARALGKLADPSAIDPLREALKSTDLELQYEAIRSLGNLRAVAAAPEVRKFLSSENKPTAYGRYLSCAAVEALGKMKDKASVKEIGKWLDKGDVERGTETKFTKYAVRALESITGQNHGSLTKSEEDGTKALDEWKKWWNDPATKKEYGVEEPPKPPTPGPGAEPPKEAPKEAPKETPK